jgi:hypothetical protein
MIWLLPHPLLFSLVSKIDQRQTGRLKRENGRKGGGDGGGAKPYDGVEAWSSVNHSIISDTKDLLIYEYFLISGS